MLSSSLVVLALLATAPDEYGPLLYLDEAPYLDLRLAVPAAKDLKATLTALDEQTCRLLFEDCSNAHDEFDMHRAMAAHRGALDQVKASVAAITTTVVLGGTACLGAYDFEKGEFPVTNYSFAAPGASRGPVTGRSGYLVTFAPVSDEAVRVLRLPPDRAEVLRKLGGCFDMRAEVRLPKPRPASLVARHVVTFRRVRLISTKGETLAVF